MTGNPTGKNGWSERNDLAAAIARAIFEQDGQAIFEAFRKVLRKGSPYAYQVLSDRAYGKLKETHRVEHGPHHDMSDEDIEKGIAELKAKLGWPESEPKILPWIRAGMKQSFWHTFIASNIRFAMHIMFIEPSRIVFKRWRGRLEQRDPKFARIPEVNVTRASTFKTGVHHQSGRSCPSHGPGIWA